MNNLLMATNGMRRNLRKLSAVLLVGIALTFGVWASLAQTADKGDYPAWWDAEPGLTSAHCTICHVPPGNPPNAHTLTIGCPGADAHLRNHALDCTGECPCNPTGNQNP
jgi:hypothetical protein